MSDVVRARRNLNLAHPVNRMPVRVKAGEIVPEELWPAIGSLNLVDGILPHLVEEGTDPESLFLDFPHRETMETILDWVLQAKGDSEPEVLQARLARATHARERELSGSGKKRPSFLGTLDELVEGLSDATGSSARGDESEEVTP